MQIFVTGGSGFVGGHLIEALTAAGHRVRALARSASSAEKVRGFGATPVSGDLESVRATDLEGCDGVIHAAAYVEEWGTRAQFWEGNVVGTTRMLDAARAALVRRFVHVGTEAALFDGHDLVDIDETAPYPQKHKFLYSETKAEAEQRVLAANAPGFTTISVRPRLVWGPRDNSVLPAIVRMAKQGSFSWIDGGAQQTSSTYVENLTNALICALEQGEGGRAYFVADDGNRTIRELLVALAATQSVVLPGKSVPGWIARATAAVVEGSYRLFASKKAPPMTRFAVTMMSRSVTVRTDRARKELGWSPRVTVEEGLRRMQSSR